MALGCDSQLSSDGCDGGLEVLFKIRSSRRGQLELPRQMLQGWGQRCRGVGGADARLRRSLFAETAGPISTQESLTHRSLPVFELLVRPRGF